MTRLSVPAVPSSDTPVAPPRRRLFALVAGAAVFQAVMGAVVWFALKPTPKVIKLPTGPAAVAFPAAQKVSPADYFKGGPGLYGWALLDVTAPGAPGDFEALAAVPWALELARQWKPDAELTRIDADALDETGRLDFTSSANARVTYRFWSPQAFAEYEASSSPSIETRYEVELYLELSGEGVRALRVAVPLPSKGTAVELPKNCTLKQVMERLRQKKKLPERHAFYSAYLIQVNFRGEAGAPWWYVSPINHAFSLPPVDARTCRPN
jgi:hypothetical protein